MIRLNAEQFWEFSLAIYCKQPVANACHSLQDRHKAPAHLGIENNAGAEMGERVLAKLGLDWGGTTANGAVTVEPVYCLGLCACGPSAMVDGKVVGRLDAARLDAILAEADA